MKLNETALSVLKNFSAINPNIALKPNEPIKTMSAAKNILAVANVPDFSVNCVMGIYDLNEFLGAVGMFKDPTLVFADDNNSVTISEGKQSIRYFFSDPEILTIPTKGINMPNVEVSFDLNTSDLESLRRAASMFGVSDLVVYGKANSDTAFVKVTDNKDATSNSFSIELTNVVRDNAVPFNLIFDVSSFKMMAGDYSVTISSKLISHFVNKNGVVEYFIALEKSSTYGE